MTRSHALIFPLVMLLLVLLEQGAEYHLRARVPDPLLRTFLIMTCYAVGFTFAAQRVTPWLKKILLALRSRSRVGGGRVGVWLFFAVCYGLLFSAYYRLEVSGPSALF